MVNSRPSMPATPPSRPVGVLQLLALGLNGIVGVGIFFAPASVAQHAPGTASILVFAVMGLAPLPAVPSEGTPGRQRPGGFVNGQPISVAFPDIIEIGIVETAPPVHGQQDNTWKPARLENEIQVLVPQFIKTGDRIRLDVNTLKYVDRAKIR